MQIIADVEDPISIVASPDNDAVLVTSSFGDEIIMFDYDPAAAMPLTRVDLISDQCDSG